jgi:RNA polymerase sigma factor (sigma-70 family)
MTVGRLTATFRRLGLAAQSDGQLLGRFLARRDGEAFAALVRRHGPMVLATCRRILGDFHAAEDAFQATFLVLARKAPAVRPPELVGPWLYGVACRTARKARAAAARRHRRERLTAEVPEPMPATPDRAPDWRPLIDAALARLPAKYRVPIVLCDLEGKGHHEAARLLGWRGPGGCWPSDWPCRPPPWPRPWRARRRPCPRRWWTPSSAPRRGRGPVRPSPPRPYPEGGRP